MKLLKLKTVMKDKSIRPEELAVKTGLSISTINKARYGGDVTLGTATLIAQGMDMDKKELAA